MIIVKAALIAAALSLTLAACADKTPLWGPNSPRNGAMQPVDPVYGTPIPGYPTINNN
jgi:predicted small lipoprotein YifL